MKTEPIRSVRAIALFLNIVSTISEMSLLTLILRKSINSVKIDFLIRLMSFPVRLSVFFDVDDLLLSAMID